MDKLIVVNLATKFPNFIRSNYSLPCSKDPETGSCLKPDESNPQSDNTFL